MKDIRVVFMGTPEFSLKSLEVLIENTNVVLVVTNKDALVGRKKILTPSPVKVLAEKNNIPVFTPESIRKEYQTVIDAKPDLIVTCAYGKIIPKELIDYPKYGCINIHSSILPKYRGAAPMQWAIINGDDETGVTLMYMDEFMDTGDIIDIQRIPINDNDDLGTIHDKLSVIGSELLLKNLNSIITGNVKRIKQNDNDATYAPKITSAMEVLDFNDNARNIFNKIRAFSPYPLTKTLINNEEIKIVSAHYTNEKSEINKIYLKNNELGIGCIDGIIYFDKIKPVGKNIMDIKSYLNGKRDILNK